MTKEIEDKVGKLAETFCKDLESVLSENDITEAIFNGRYDDSKKVVAIDFFVKDGPSLRISSKPLGKK